tara:strand:- start:7863 stop:8339 length:477 start_codon:yes stop_codon:yes gene_type:complete
MDKLIRVALATKFKQEDVENILLICEKTDNISVAVEILLGLYEEPKFADEAKDDEYYTNRVFLSYDPFKDKVTFSGNRVIKTYAWFLKGALPIDDNVVSEHSYANDAMKEKNFKGDRDEFESLYERKLWKQDVREKAETSTTSSYNWIKEEKTYELAE